MHRTWLFTLFFAVIFATTAQCQLPAENPDKRQIQIDAMVIDLTWGEANRDGVLKNLGLLDEQRTTRFATPNTKHLLTTCTHKEQLRTLGMLRALGVAKFLAEPRLVTLNGREAAFLSGGQLPVRRPSGEVEFVSFGLHLKLIPTIEENGRIRLNLNIEQSYPEQAKNKKSQAKVVKSWQMQTNANLAGGETLAIVGPAARGNKTARNTELLLLFTPREVDPTVIRRAVTKIAPAPRLPARVIRASALDATELPTLVDPNTDAQPVRFSVAKDNSLLRLQCGDSIATCEEMTIPGYQRDKIKITANEKSKRISMAASTWQAHASEIIYSTEARNLHLKGGVEIRLRRNGREEIGRADSVCIDLSTGRLRMQQVVDLYSQ